MFGTSAPLGSLASAPLVSLTIVTHGVCEVTVPAWCSGVPAPLGIGLPSESVPWPSAVQLSTTPAAPDVNVQVKSWLIPAARVNGPAGVKPPAQAPPPVTETPVRGSVPLLVSVTVTVIDVPGGTVVPGVTLFVESVVAGAIEVTEPAWCSGVPAPLGIGLP